MCMPPPHTHTHTYTHTHTHLHTHTHTHTHLHTHTHTHTHAHTHTHYSNKIITLTTMRAKGPLDFTVPGHFSEEPDRVVGHGLLDLLAHGHQSVQDFVTAVQFGDVVQEPHGNGLQRL